MKITFTPNLQRDMHMDWDSSVPPAPKPKQKSKQLDIQNINKLEGIVTSHIFDVGFVCVRAYDRNTHYELHYTGTSHTGKRMEVLIQKEPRMSLDANNNVEYKYLVEIRKKLVNVTGIPYSSPSVYALGHDMFSNPIIFNNWLDGKLRRKQLDYEQEVWEQKPWYEKAFIKVKKFIDNTHF